MNFPPPSAADESARLFLALWPDDALRRALLALRDAWHWPASTALVAPKDLHLTLHFLGSVPIGRLPELAGLGLLVPCETFTLSLGRAALWPHGVAVLQTDGPDAVAPPLERLHGALRLALARLGLPADDRGYQPHITLARHAQAAVPPPQGPALRWPVAGYALARSWPGKTGGYSLIRRHSFDRSAQE